MLRVRSTWLAWIAAFAVPRAAEATCEACDVAILHEDCTPAPVVDGFARNAEGTPLLVAGSCAASCGETLALRSGTYTPSLANVEACTSPVAGSFSESTCSGAKVHRYDGAVPRGAFVVTWDKSPVARIAVGGDPPAACASVPLASGGGSTGLIIPPPPPPPPQPLRSHDTLRLPRGIDDWEDRHGAAFEIGPGAFGGGTFAKRVGSGYLGGVYVLGLHVHVHPGDSYHSEKGDWLSSNEGFRWCVPIVACGVIGLLFAPAGSLLANDFGVDLRLGGAGESGQREGAVMRAALRPTLRYAHGTFRTGTYIGILVPEIGVALPDRAAAAATLAWSLYPVDVLVAPGIALTLDPRIGAYIPTNGTPVAIDLGLEIGLRWLPVTR